MPVSRRLTEGLATEVAAAYGRVEVRLLQLIARHLAAGTDSAGWAEAKFAELQTFRRRAQSMTAAARREAEAELVKSITTAYLRGAAAGQGDIDALGIDLGDVPPRHAERAVEALVRAQAGQLDELGLRVVRNAADAYRDAVVRAVAGTLTGAATRLQDAQVALNDLGKRGITGLTDAAGRRWDLTTYVEMATRSTTAQAAVTAHLDRLEDAGIPLVIVSDSSRECELCRPWEGKVLSRGPVGALLPNALTGELERVRIDGTVSEATSAGLFHPNCTHNLSAYIPGATKRGGDTGNPEGDEERQEQRRLERGIREWKRRQAVAVTPEAKRKADAKVREWSQRAGEHASATGLNRKRNRESLTAAR